MHTAQIEKLDAAAVAAHVKERIEDRTAQFGDRDDADAKKARSARAKFEKERYADGAWEVTCECGWAANNPLPSREAAEEARDEHYAAVRRELAVVGGPGGVSNG